MNYATMLQLVLKHSENIVTFSYLFSSILKQINIFLWQINVYFRDNDTSYIDFSATVSAAGDFLVDFMHSTFWTNTCYCYFSIMIDSLNKVMLD